MWERLFLYAAEQHYLHWSRYSLYNIDVLNCHRMNSQAAYLLPLEGTHV